MFRSILFGLGFLFAGHMATAQVVAKVGDASITLKDFKEKYDEVRRTTINPPSPEVFLDDLVRYEMGIQEAKKKKAEEDPKIREHLRQELYKAFIENQLGKQVEAIEVNEAEMRTYYKSNPEIRSSHILIEFKADATPEQIKIAEKRANEIYSEVRKSKRPFEELVKLYSDDTLSKDSGGDMGFHNSMTVVPTYYEALKSTKPGEISKPVRSLYGFHILKVTGRRSFEEANRRQIRAAVFDIKRKKIFDAYFKKIGSNYKVTKNEKLIKSL